MRNTTLKVCALIVCAVMTVGMNSAVCDAINMPPPTNPGCTPQGVPSITLTVTDAFGFILPTADISFTVDDQNLLSGSCINGCEDFALAFDTLGEFDVSVSAAGYEPRRLIVNVISNDNCTPDTEERIVVLEEDETIGAIAGAWRANTVFGTIDIRFGDDGRAIGAILYDRVAGGDGNIYVSYNANPIRGVSGQQIAVESVQNPTRNGDIFNFDGTALGVPVGFVDAGLTEDFATLVGGQPSAGNQFINVTYGRLGDIPLPLQDP